MKNFIKKLENNKLVNIIWMIGHFFAVYLFCSIFTHGAFSDFQMLVYKLAPLFFLIFFAYSCLIQYSRESFYINKEIVIFGALLVFILLYNFFTVSKPEPAGSVNEALRTLCNFLYVYAIYVTYSWPKIYSWVKKVVVIDLILTIMAQIILNGEDYMWSIETPLFGSANKNRYALFVGVVFIIFVAEFILLENRTFFNGLMLVLVTMFIFYIKSDTAEISAIATLLIALSYKLITKRMNSAIYGLIIGIAALVIFLSFENIPSLNELIFDIFKKDATLSNRTTIWLYGLQMLMVKPLLGLGFGYVTMNFDLGPISGLYSEMPAHAHNGVLDLALRIGIPLTIVLWLYFAVIDKRIRKASKFDKSFLVFYAAEIFYFSRMTMEDGFHAERIFTIIFMYMIIKFSNKEEYQDIKMIN